ncbi:MAG: hydrogenase maturation protease [Bryobacteraceae bacterium]
MRHPLSETDRRPHLAPLVIGYGNRMRGDDAAGPLAIDVLRESGARGLRLDVFEGDGSALIDRWGATDTVVMIDAVVSGLASGEVRVFTPGDLGAGIRCVSTHGLGLIEAVRLAKAIGRMPAQLWIVGVEAERFELGSEPSPAVRRGAHDAARIAIERWGGGPCTS